MMSLLRGLTEAQIEGFNQELNSLLSHNPEVSAALLATTDGFEMACAGEWGSCLPSSVAAMASSMLSLAIAMVKETGLSPCQNLIIETETGKVMLMSVPSSRLQMLLAVMTQKDVAFGQLLLEARIAARQLSNILETV